MGGGRVEDGELDAWAAGARAQEAAAARTRQRWLRQQADEQADFTSLLVDLCERSTPTAVVTSSGRTHHGRITVVGRDCLVVVTTRGRSILIAAAAVVAVRPDDEKTVMFAVDSRPTGTESMAEVVRRAAIDRPTVTVHMTGATEAFTGELHACGLDVVALLLADNPSAPAYLKLASVSEMSFDSG